MKTYKAIGAGELLNKATLLYDVVSKALAKRSKKGIPPAALVMVCAGLLDKARKIMLENGYSEAQFEKWVDVGERYFDAREAGRGPSEADLDAFKDAWEDYPKEFEKLPGFSKGEEKT